MDWNYIVEQAEKEDVEVFAVDNYAGEKVIGIIKDGREICLGSMYNKGELVNVWCDGIDVKNPWSIVVLMGFADGAYIRELRRRNADMMILVYEPSYSVIKLNFDIQDMEDILSDEKIIVMAGEEEQHNFSVLFDSVAQYERIAYTHFAVSPNYSEIFGEVRAKLWSDFVDTIVKLKLDKNTIMAYGDELLENVIMNMSDCIEQYALADFVDLFKSVDLEGIPAIVVSAGPSLSKNIHDLKQAKGRAFIIAVDTVLNAMDAAGIEPDIAITVDPHKPLRLFESEMARRVPLVREYASNYKITGLHGGMRLYANSDESMLDRYLHKFQKKKISLATGGSVACTAFSMAVKLGFKTIILVGQDLAYTDNQHHAKETLDAGAKNDVTRIVKEFIEVEDIYGNMVKTEYNMEHYRQWFERMALTNGSLCCIDATEGGAKIGGTEIMKLSEAIERECTAETAADWKSVFEALPHTFTAEEKADIYEGIANIGDYFNELRKKIRKGIKSYETLDSLNRRQIYSGKRFDRTIEEIEEINRWAQENEDIAYINLYAAEEDYEVRSNIYEEKESTYEEIKLMVNGGISILNALLDAIDRVEEAMESVKRQRSRE